MSQHHDPVHPDSEHLTAEVLADLDLGLLDDASAERARHHLDHCAQCTQLHADLAALTESLRSLGAPGSGLSEPVEPMPDEVWTRLESALAAAPVVTPEGAATVVPMAPQRTRRWGRPGIGVVAAIAGVALVGAIVVPKIGSSDSDDSAVSAGSDSSTTEDSGRQLPESAYRATRSGTQYSEETLETQVTELVAARTALTPDELASGVESQYDEDSSPGGADVTVSPSVSVTGAPEPIQGKLARSGALATSPAAAQACLEGYLDVTGVTPLAIDIGLWEGEPAAVIVLPKDDPALAEVWVIDPSCSTASANDPLIYFATITR